MDEDGKFILNPDCLLEIMNYVITDCKLKGQNVVQCSSNYDDLIHFVLADEVFWELLVVHHKRLYEDLEMAISAKIIKLLIDMRVNKIPSENEHCWGSYLRSIREKSPYNVELSFEDDKEKRDHTYVNISIKGNSTHLTNTEKLKLINGNITTQELTYICILNQTNLKLLTFEGSKIHGSFSDIVPFCENLEELRISLIPGDGAAQYGSLAKLPNLKTFVLSGIQESGSQLLFFNDLRKWSRPKSLQPLTLTIEDCLSDKRQPIAFATWDSLRYMHIHNYEVNSWQITKLNVLVKFEYDLCELSEDSSSIEESLATITLGKYVKVKFSRCKEELEVKIHRESDISQMGSLSKLPNLKRLVIHHKCNYLDYPDTLATFLQAMGPSDLKFCKINYSTIDELECKELSKMKSIRYLGCHPYDWNSTKFISQLSNLQHLQINVRREALNDNNSELVLNLLNACQVQASIMTEVFRVTLKRNENKMEIHIFWNSFRADILAPLAQLTGVNTLQISGCPNTGSLNPFFQAFATSNLNTIEEIDLSQMEKISFDDISKVAGIKTLTKLTCCLSDTTGIEKLASLNKLEDIDIFGNGNLAALFIKLAEKDSIQRIRYSEGLDPEEVIRVSRIRSLKKLDCFFTDVEDVPSLSDLANSSIEELIVKVSKPTCSLLKLFEAFSSCRSSRLQHLEVTNKTLDITEMTEISKIKGLKTLRTGFLCLKSAAILDRLVNLENLVIKNNVLALKSLPMLQKLHLCYQIGFSECNNLVELEKLESLKCSLAKESGIEVLANINNLKELFILKTKDSLTKLYRAFALRSQSTLRELHTQISSSDEIREISQIKSLITLNIGYNSTCDNLSDLGQLSELKSLHIVSSENSSIDTDSILLIIKFCKNLDCVTLEFKRGQKVAVNFVSKVNSILKSIRNIGLQKPLQLTLVESTVFPKFHVDDIDESYLNVVYSYKTHDPNLIVDFMSDGEESDDSETYDIDWY
ncbi:uncharacterized protein LOC108147384 [Drosophila elegans]|uniref:uncharacterized protein LOC108147384 n=1 Tax=Drosophila elegans TaxID=30023 RepID=UPI0007E61E4C|nr:uncharacterized protein LOC108147384 [Drosophila elegans]